MKKFILLIAAACFFTVSFAQFEAKGKEFSHYVFPEFMEGIVKQKSGELHKSPLNYNTITEEMIFTQPGDIKLALDKLEDIDTVFLGGRIFVPVDKVFYEVATNTAVPLLIEHKSGLIPPGSNTGFGTTQTSAASNITDLKSSGLAYPLKLPDDYKIVNQTVYWLLKDGKYISLKNEKDVENVFQPKAALIKDFAKKNKISFRKPEDVIKLIEFAN